MICTFPRCTRDASSWVWVRGRGWRLICSTCLRSYQPARKRGVPWVAPLAGNKSLTPSGHRWK